MWLLEGHVLLSKQELLYLAELPDRQPQLKVVLEMGGDRQFSWQPLRDVI
jgi:NAD(P)H-quinone oxidoreductase subunit N